MLFDPQLPTIEIENTLYNASEQITKEVLREDVKAHTLSCLYINKSLVLPWLGNPYNSVQILVAQKP